jgi:hypothetical protein
MSVDLRTCTDGPRRRPEEFFEHDLPAAPTRRGLAPGTARLDLRPMTIEVDGDAWTLSALEDRVDVSHGSRDGSARINLGRDQLEDLVHDQQTFMGMWSSGR